ncbi:hypothetical protein [Flavivirga eckloniae]|uniref:DUF4304 domain-containing protein n=1 Tax=Flavivirga eckloniae TaxID=1803846 RepID=A0A2K9PQX3_9FLAO|nr:hypothetical protein [Flavivirga eckloniae]AUP79461.1 hypothetical protein C1H87_12390 [Flavivirga eckloniae]
MRLFGKKKNIVQTDKNLKPSERFEKVLLSRLEKEGYKHLKSKHEFVQDFEHGKRVINLSYNNTFGYISTVQYFIKIVFRDLEKSFKKAHPNYGWTNWTIHENLHWTESTLYDDKADDYTDRSINNLADEFFREIKPRIDSTFSKIGNYSQLNEIYNTNPSEFIDYLPPSRPEKRIINGLILTKALEPEKFEIRKNQYFLLLNKYKENDFDEIRKEVELGLTFLNENEIKINTTTNKTYKQ